MRIVFIITAFFLADRPTGYLSSDQIHFIEPPCKISDVLQLKNKKLQSDFFKQLDSIHRMQYPDGNPDSAIFIDMTPKMLNQFLKDIDTAVLSKTGRFEKEYHFKIAPKGFTDPATCKDKITIEFYPGSCGYRIVIDNTFLVQPNWCTESEVSYYFKIRNGLIVDFGRQAAG